MRRITPLLAIWFLFLLACSRPTNTGAPATIGEGRRISSTDVVKVSTEQATVPRGGSADALVHLKIDNGFHVNANPPTYSFLIATEIELKPEGGVLVNFITYPDPQVKKFPFAEKPLAVYEGESLIKVKLRAEQSASPGRKNVPGKLRVQACDDQVCYAPGTVDVAIPLEVK
ncbi:MAG TPA: protein-disulfide reductase DsbD domain-containing protein [Pyrinomonadaceae bacterium]